MSQLEKSPTNPLKVLVVSVGGSLDQIRKSISERKSDVLVLLTSPASMTTLQEIIAEMDEKDKPNEDRIHYFTTPDAQDLVQTFSTVEALFQKVQTIDPTKENTIVDYTGGTKVMSSALVSVALLRGFDKLSYVGGSGRTKDGLGVVVTGSELPLLSRNPIRLQGYFELQKLVELYKKHEYNACVEICREAKASDWIEDKELFADLESVFLYYHHRDLFDFGKAFSSLSRKFRDQDYLARYPEWIRKFMKESYQGRMGMEELANISREFKSYQTKWDNDPKNPPGFEKLQNLNFHLLLTEIYMNAERRAEQGKYDDAVLRHYRLLEMTAQLQLLMKYKIYNSYTLPEQIPNILREEYIQRFRFTHPKSRMEFLKYGMEASFQVLQALGDPIANFYNPKDREKGSPMDQFRNIQSSRNLSILAHGLAPIGEDTYSKLKSSLALWNLVPKDSSGFPKWSDKVVEF